MCVVSEFLISFTDREDVDALGKYTMPLAKLPPDSEFRPNNVFFRKGEPGDWRRFFHADALRWLQSERDTVQLMRELNYDV